MSYSLALTADEYKSLAWLADRYSAAEALFDALKPADDATADGDGGGSYALTESDAWIFADFYRDGDGGAPYAIPCCGGSLAEKIDALFEAIV